jgi:hypothetical protein
MSLSICGVALLDVAQPRSAFLSGEKLSADRHDVAAASHGAQACFGRPCDTPDGTGHPPATLHSGLSKSGAPGVEECKKACTRTIAFAYATLACALNVRIFLTRSKSTVLRIALIELRDKFTSVRHPLRTCIPSELYERSVRHHIVWKAPPWVTWVVNESWLPVVIDTSAHLNTPYFGLIGRAKRRWAPRRPTL